jgi:hypothetical protein
MKHLIKYKDGSIGIMTTVLDETRPEDEFLKCTPEYVDNVEGHRPMEESEMPEDRYFRGAWTHSDDKINVDMDKAKDIHRNVLRELRKPKLEALDIEFIRADETFDDEEKSLIRIKKQELRDVTQAPEIVNAKSLEELKSFMPDILK